MADRKPTVMNPAGYQENLQDTDNLVAAALPTADNHVVNRAYLKVVQDEIDGDIDLAGRWTLDCVNLYPRGDDQNVRIGGTLPNDPNIELSANGTATFGVNGTTNGRINLRPSGVLDTSFTIASGSANGDIFTLQNNV